VDSRGFAVAWGESVRYTKPPDGTILVFSTYACSPHGGFETFTSRVVLIGRDPAGVRESSAR
jgi:hypothetical protein